MDLSLAHRRIGRQHPPFIIAERSGNHNQSLERALAIIEAAAEAGAHGLKIQITSSGRDPMPDEARDDFDRPWKEALERYFPEFVAAV